ncbi:hypothetical protein BKA56DRAFT_731119 [Ilyonectria sp. MPI-CAGE-AT-0026]|nr:hypothetical protein BKA56DRAFT_731119 [Ilyonectria sp. MPI-CAGE-AT-0026]
MSTTTTTIATMGHTHKAPAMFCAPGNPQDVKNGFGGFGDSIDAVAPWPSGSRLRLTMLSTEKVPGWVTDIIRSAVTEWTNGLGEPLEVQWVSANETSHIRISFRNEVPSWSCVGARAAMYEQSKPTMNFNFGGWKSTKVVYSPAYVRRLAYHLFGHALGLPHALLSQWPIQCKPGELEKLCGPYYAQMLGSAKGCSLLRDAQSIMHYEVPAALGTKGIDLLQGGRGIDSEALALVRSLYPPVPQSSLVTCIATQLPGFQSGWSGRANGKRFISTAQTGNIVTGLNRLDLGTNGNFRVYSEIEDIQRGSGYSLKIITDADADLIDATCDVLSFDEADQRIRTGRVQWHHLPGGNARSYRENFSRPFNKPPNVVAFISGFDSIKGRSVRIDVKASAIDRNGFTLDISTWSDSIIYQIAASWIAHEPDDWTIRSGYFSNPYDPNLTLVARCTNHYSSPMRRRPSKLFCALSHIDVGPQYNVRLSLTATWDETKVESVLSTWEEQSKFVVLAGSYVAIL